MFVSFAQNVHKMINKIQKKNFTLANNKSKHTHTHTLNAWYENTEYKQNSKSNTSDLSKWFQLLNSIG